MLALDVEILGLPSTLSLGRMPVVVGDGRLVGTEPFDARGRTLDGASLDLRGSGADGALGLVWLAPQEESDDDATGEAASGFGFVDVALHPRVVAGVELELEAHGLLHRDGPRKLTLPTAGLRLGAGAAPASSLRLTGSAGVELQSPLRDGGSIESDGLAARATGDARASYALSSSLPRAPDFFAGLSAEITAGSAVAGRVLHAPAPSQHGALGLLDLVAADNTWSAALDVGTTTDRGLLVDVTGRLVGIVDRSGPLLDVAGDPIPQRTGSGLALVEIDARVELPLSRELSLGAAYGLALPGAALVGDQPAQRLLLTLRAVAGVPGVEDEARGAALP
jgi:hypothetical protein